MTAAIEAQTATATWGNFDLVKDQLYDQYENIAWDESSGLPLDELRRLVWRYLKEHAHEPRILQKAHVYRILVTQGQIALEPWDWFPSKLNHGRLLWQVRERWYDELKVGALAEDADWFRLAREIGIANATLDTGHISPGWENMFAGGLQGLLAQARSYREALGDQVTPDQLAFYEAIEIVYEASCQLAERFAALAERMIADHPEHEERLRILSHVCRRVPAHAPRTFHEALQFSFTMHELIEMEGELVRSMGHFDRVWYPYYAADIQAGRLTRGQAKELLQFLWYKFYSRTRGRENGKNFCFAGQDAQGHLIENELTYVALEAYEEMNTPDPKLSVRFLPEHSDRLYRRVADLIRKGHNSFVLMNDAVAVGALVKRGKPIEDARTYLPIGCYEPAVDGKEAGCTMNLTLNLAKAIEYALHDGRDPLSGLQVGPRTGDPRTFGDFDALYAATLTQLDYLLTRTVDAIRAHEGYWMAINPAPLIAGTISDCLERGKDIGQGGPHYNSTGAVGAALANLADSLLAVKQTIYDQGRYTMAELLEAIDSDFEGREPMRLYLLKRVPKWGNGDPAVDALARAVADHYCAKVHSLHNTRGGDCQAALFSLVFQWTAGRVTGALPDGRKAGETLAPNVGAMPGRDKAGVTGHIDSVTKLDFTSTPNGSVLDITLHPTAVSGEHGLEAFVQLIKTFLAQGGYAIQFNIFDVKTLRAAQRHPERYATLQIRVTGWSVYFTSLSRFEQDQFILRNTHAL
ncbi:MAG: hypothetical protein JXA74_02120 [Anaerolineae bacterium]|nr:hypothetical protein [Anaerolineae bacterium]